MPPARRSGQVSFRHSFAAPVAAIRADPAQPRKSFDEEALRVLAGL